MAVIVSQGKVSFLEYRKGNAVVEKKAKMIVGVKIRVWKWKIEKEKEKGSLILDSNTLF